MKTTNAVHTSVFLFLLMLLSLLSSCGEESLFSEEDVSTIEQSIFVVPEDFSGQPFLSGSPAKKTYIDINETAKFWAVYSLDGLYLTQRQASDYIQETLWEIENEFIDHTVIMASFDTPGHRQILLHSTDFLNDTITDTLDVFVNTPIGIELLSPMNKYNLVDPLAEEGVYLSWKISGSDSWENSTCSIFASSVKDSVWDNLIEQNDCSKKVQIEGSLVKELDKDTSLTFYWAVKAANFVDDGFIEIASSPIYQFSTKFIHSDSAVISIPIKYNSLKEQDIVSTQITVVNTLGDTLGVIHQNKPSTTIKFKVKPQPDLHIFLKEKRRTEYSQDSLRIDVPEASLFAMDTVFFYDSIPPQVAPLKERILSKDSIRFYALDNGSGIDATRTSYIAGSDTLHANFKNSIISFKNPCIRSCTIQVIAFDNAMNQSPETYWNIEIKTDSTFIYGPFPQKGDTHE